jgi:D-alanyl-D-alanine carboxypeptidase/D-alanyl-D-alanine-endopeptidase (penicillin-binding protein 4)
MVGIRGALISVLVPVCALAAGPGLESQLRATLADLPHAQTVCGACVIDLATGRTVFALGADRALVPASNTKVFVMAAARDVLGSEFAFETSLATDGENLFLIGGGDPGLGDAKLSRKRGETIYSVFEWWADVLVEAGLTAVPGDLVFDESIFDNQRVHPSWEPGDLGTWYATPTAGLNFNDNCVDITLTPSKTPGKLVAVSKVPDCDLIRIVNACKSGGRGRPTLHNPPGTFDYRITGRCEKVWPFGAVAFPEPGMLCAGALRTVLERKGITLNGAVRPERVRRADGSLRLDLELVGRHRTPLIDVLNRLGKDSQNLFAECLIKRIGYEWMGRRGEDNPQGGWGAGGKAVLETIGRMGVDTTGLMVADGSGLSRDNRCTARQLAATLAWIHGQSTGQLMRDSLSIAGVDGSLRKRLKDMPGCIHGKTGTMRGVRTLSGYVDNGPAPGRSSRTAYAFAILFNGYKGPSTPYREIQDRFCRVLAKASARGS